MTLEQLVEQRDLARRELELILLRGSSWLGTASPPGHIKDKPGNLKAVNVTPLKEEFNYGVPNTV